MGESGSVGWNAEGCTMCRWYLGLTFVVWVASLGAAPPEAKESQAVAATRKKLQVKITVDFKEEQLRVVLDDVNMQLKQAGHKPIEWKFDMGVSKNQRTTVRAENKSVADVLDKLLKVNALGYVIRPDGHILIKQGRERGRAQGEPSTKPKAEEPADKPAPKEKPAEDGDKSELLAERKLTLTKVLIDDGKVTKAQERLEEIIKDYPKTQAADEARELLRKLKKK
jgi:TolA-binding protein